MRRLLAVTFVVTCVTAWFSYAYFAIDEYFQVIEFARFKLGHVEAWALPWEHQQKMRPFLQPGIYFVIGKVLGVFGVTDAFTLSFAFRLVTGITCVGALALFLKTSLPWFSTDEERRLHLRVLTLAGFLPYLFVRTSSETAACAAITSAFALLLARATAEEKTWTVPALGDPRRLALVGFLAGIAFDVRYQSVFLALGLFAWLRFVGRAPWRSFAPIVAGGVVALVLGALVDRFGYGEWCFPAWTYFKANLLEGVASLFGTDPPFAYVYLLPANVFFPLVVVLFVVAVVTWWRCRRHPITWTTLPFFLVHNLLSHKEERFVFPMMIFALSFVALAIAPSVGSTNRFSAWAWKKRNGALAKALAVMSFLGMALLAFYPLGWHHHVRFTKYVHDHMNDELVAYAPLEFDLGLPAWHPKVWQIEKHDEATIVRLLDEDQGARRWLVTDLPRLEAPLADRATLVWSEEPFYDNATLHGPMRSLIDAYNARSGGPLRRLRFRSLYRLDVTSARSPIPPAASSR